jgi:hypothetical protein
MYKEQQSGLGVRHDKRICVFSQRHLQQLLSACGDYEFEDLLCKFDNVDILTAQPLTDLRPQGGLPTSSPAVP